MKNNEVKIMVFSALLIAIFLCSSVIYLNSYSILNEKKAVKNDIQEDLTTTIKSPKMSAGEITIKTPENKTYTGPMSGYYPASLGFENDVVGAYPSGWGIISGSNGFIRVVDAFNNHMKVVELRKTGGTTKQQMEYYFSINATVGTVEFWLYKDTNGGGYDPTRITIGDLHCGVQNGQFFAGGWSTSPNYVATFTKDTWHRIRIDFDVAQGWQLQIDGTWINSGYSYSFVQATTKLTYMFMSSIFSGDCANYGAWIDAIGFSWYPDYEIGDNINNGLLLGFNNNTNLDWMRYSLDNGIKVPISGNKTIPMPANGSHTIQVFGNNTGGTEFQSEKRYFLVSPIILISPENKIYNTPMSGYYPATYGFENDDNNVDPKDFFDVSTGPSDIRVVDNIGGHRKVIELYDPNDWDTAMWNQTFTKGPQTNGTIEWWFRTTAAGSNRDGNYQIYRDGTSNGAINFGPLGEAGDFFVSNGTNILSLGFITLANTWYHLRVDFECGFGNYMGLSNDTWRLYIDGVSQGVYKFVTMATALYTFHQETRWKHYGYLYYTDAIGYSWDPYYTIGDNLKEGLLMSYTSAKNLSWKGYSLDGQLNKTIQGNTTLKMPADGAHTIQIFGNNTSGSHFLSEKRHFTVDTIAPTIAGSSGELTLEQFEPYTIQWNITEINGGNYSLTQNQIKIDGDSFNHWDNVSWIANTTILGDINYTIVATDISNKNGTRSILIHVVDTTSPSIEWLTSDFSIYQGQLASFSWRILEHNPTNYAIYDNGTMVKPPTDYDNYTFNSYSFLNWTIGQHIFMVRANDSQGHSSSAYITVTVLERSSQYRFLIPNQITPIDLILTQGLYLEFSANATGFVEVVRQTSNFPGIDEVKVGNLKFFYFYNFTIYDADLTENDSIIENASVRFYYNPALVNKPSNIRLYHLIYDIANVIWIWKLCDFTINETRHYIEFNTTDFSIFTMALYNQPPPPDDDDDKPDTKRNKDMFAVIFGDYLVLIVIGAAVGVAVPSAYVFKSRKKKKEATITGLEEKAKIKRENLMKEGDKLSKSIDATKAIKEQQTKYAIPALPKEGIKAKKAKKLEVEQLPEKLSPEKQKEIEKTEQEIALQVKKDICTVHKSPIQGINYICPKCQAKYCMRCARTLASKNEGCWVCETPIKLEEEVETEAVVPETTTQSDLTRQFVNNKAILEKLKRDNGSDSLDLYKDLDLTTISEEMWEKIRKINMDQDQKKIFVKEMLSLTPKERLEIIDDILKKQNLNED